MGDLGGSMAGEGGFVMYSAIRFVREQLLGSERDRLFLCFSSESLFGKEKNGCKNFDWLFCGSWSV